MSYNMHASSKLGTAHISHITEVNRAIQTSASYRRLRMLATSVGKQSLVMSVRVGLTNESWQGLLPFLSTELWIWPNSLFVLLHFRK